jgi:hypothetical protein
MSTVVMNRYCDNTIVKNNKEYKLEKIWRNSKNDQTRDSKGELYPFPKNYDNEWSGNDVIENRLANIHEYLNLKKKYEIYSNPMDCLLCGAKNVTTRRYRLMNIMWEDGIEHYIKMHNIEPSIQFKQFILNKKNGELVSELYRTIKKPGSKSKSKSKSKFRSESESKAVKEIDKSQMLLQRVVKDDKEYVMIERNQILILDALMIHGGYIKKYIDVNENLNRYSEHAGFLDFENNSLSKIVVSGKTTRVDKEDAEIYLPMSMRDMYEYEYIFHTHPPTPKPGGRAVDGILYEIPSIGDIYHFIDHHNGGNVIGSLVVAAEGLYNIRKYEGGAASIKIDDNNLYKKYDKAFMKMQNAALERYGSKFTLQQFYKEIAQDTTFIDMMNTTLNVFNIHIDYYPRKKDAHNKWVIDTVFLVFRENKHK